MEPARSRASALTARRSCTRRRLSSIDRTDDRSFFSFFHRDTYARRRVLTPGTPIRRRRWRVLGARTRLENKGRDPSALFRSGICCPDKRPSWWNCLSAYLARFSAGLVDHSVRLDLVPRLGSSFLSCVNLSTLERKTILSTCNKKWSIRLFHASDLLSSLGIISWYQPGDLFPYVPICSRVPAKVTSWQPSDKSFGVNNILIPSVVLSGSRIDISVLSKGVGIARTKG